MTAHSEHGGFITTPLVPHIADDPVDTSVARDVLLNNTIHAYDQHTQVRVHDVPLAGTSAGLSPRVPSLTTFRWACGYPSLSMHVMADGRTAPLVVRLCALVTSGTGYFAVALRPQSGSLDGQQWRAGGIDDSYLWDGAAAYASTASTSFVWIDPTPDYLQLSASAVAAAAVEFEMPETDGGNTGKAKVILCRLDVWCYGPGCAVGGCYAREFVG